MTTIFQDDDPLLSVNQAAALLGIHRTSLYRLYTKILNKNPTTVTRNKHKLYRRSAVLQFLKPVDLKDCEARTRKYRNLNPHKRYRQNPLDENWGKTDAEKK